MKKAKNDGVYVKKYSAQTRGLIGTDAGSSNDLHELRIKNIIYDKKRKSERYLKKAKKAHSLRNISDSKKFVSQALDYAAKAYFWSETTKYQDDIHSFLHEVAKWNHDNLGCVIRFENDQYTQKCVIAYTHKRIGISPGFYSDKICSLCDEDLARCTHKTTRTYWVRGNSRKNDGRCRICLQKHCDHKGNYIYRTAPISEMKNPIIEEISLVKYPRNPEMRIVKEFHYSAYDMLKRSNFKLKVGKSLYCNLCAEDCPGFDELNF